MCFDGTSAGSAVSSGGFALSLGSSGMCFDGFGAGSCGFVMSLGGFGMCGDGSGAGSCALVMSFGSSGMVFDGSDVGSGMSSSGFVTTSAVSACASTAPAWAAVPSS